MSIINENVVNAGENDMQVKMKHKGSISTAERKKMLSRPRLTEEAILAEAHRRCYLGRGSQNVLSQTRFFFFKFCSGSSARALVKLLFLQNWCQKIVKNIRCNLIFVKSSS